MAESVKPLKGRVLLTGGSGFIASHTLDALLDDGFGVVASARSHARGRRILDSVDPTRRERVSYVVVEDVAKDGAFDAVFEADPNFDYVVHTASPYHLNVEDPIKDFLDPAINGTTGLLRSIKAYSPATKRVVITSSGAAIINPLHHANVYDETCWAPWTREHALNPKRSYEASKVLSEKAAWSFMEAEKPSFDLVTINCTYTFGPIQRNITSLDAINTSNHRVRDLVLGRVEGGLKPTEPVFVFVDVRDVALAHVRAITVPAAGGNRFYVVGGYFSNKRIADIVGRCRPDLAAHLPSGDAARDDLPDNVYAFDNGKSRRVLGLEYTGLEKSIRDTVQSILEVAAVEERAREGSAYT
ncbi:NAD(P)-binding protein [Durotheca rogersii]|uniref:NAD(P)-binding protein n=1 Tax=Durotheca rogersii TaxID=419775 RepID=UPI002220FDC4|nr:NAD(P)-binding protein [Durotheca rogersii]KAI5860984.1 NAD(P)-binding protein [Durotheca rogersii]